MVMQVCYAMIVASGAKEWLLITTHQTLSAGNCFEPPLAKSLNVISLLNWMIQRGEITKCSGPGRGGGGGGGIMSTST